MSDNDKPQFESARGTLALATETSSPPDPLQAAEARMRRALGLDGEQSRMRLAQERVESPQRPGERFTPGGHKRRFVHDGEVPVTLVHGLVPGRRDNGDTNGGRNGANAQPTNRLEVAEAALAAEIATRERAERALHEAQATVHDLQTKFGHAELARQEATEALRRERESMAELRAALQAAEAEAATAREARDTAEQALAALREQGAESAAPTRRGRPPGRRPAMVPEVISMPEVMAMPDAMPAPDAVPVPEAMPAPEVPVVPRKTAAAKRVRSAEAAPAREPKPIRWWLTPRKKKQR